MALVDYPSSDEDESRDGPSVGYTREISAPTRKDLKRKHESYSANNSELPPLPSKFHDLYASKARVSTLDDPSLHGGRKRITPHVEGNWPSHVYIEWYPSTAEHAVLTSLITSMQDAAVRDGGTEIMSLLTSDLGSPLPLHISLSRPIVFTATEKDSFVESLRRNILGCGVRPFELKLGSLSWVSNSENTRWFLALRLHKPMGAELNTLLDVCNSAVEDYSQPPLYACPRSRSLPSRKITARPIQRDKNRMDPSTRGADILDFSNPFHFSIGWALEQPEPHKPENSTKATADGSVSQSLTQISVKVDMVKAKIGNVITSMSLSPRSLEEQTLFGA